MTPSPTAIGMRERKLAGLPERRKRLNEDSKQKHPKFLTENDLREQGAIYQAILELTKFISRAGFKTMHPKLECTPSPRFGPFNRELFRGSPNWITCIICNLEFRIGRIRIQPGAV